MPSFNPNWDTSWTNSSINSTSISNAAVNTTGAIDNDNKSGTEVSVSIAYGGTASQGVKVYVFTGGGVVVGGSGLVTSSNTIYPTGGVVVGGNAVPTGSMTYTPDGGVLVGGDTAETVDNVWTPTGGVVVGGAASIEVLIGVHGGVVVGGSATVQVAYAVTPTGGVVIGPGRFANGYKYRVAITVPAGKVASDQTNFPILLNLTLNTAHVASQSDLRFEDGSSNHLPHEVIHWNSTTGVLHCAVKASIAAAGTTIYLYYGGT